MEKRLIDGLAGIARTVFQVLLLTALWWGADWIARRYFPELPGSVFGLFLAVILLGCGILPRAWVEHGARWLLAEMLLFFIPSVVAIVKYPTLVRDYGLQIMLIVVLGTLLVMVVTAVAVDLAMRVEARFRKEEA